MGKIKAFFRNKWVGFTLAALLYTLWFVVWTGNLWLLLGLPVIYDLYVSRLFYRYVWSRNRRMCERSKTYKAVYEWVNAIVFATVVATLVHIFVFQMYVIPSSSMESSLLIGDYLYVSKVTYGPQMPNTPLSFPFVHHTMPFSETRKSYSEAIKWPYHRLKGLRRIARNDVVVFNFPAGDTVLLENQAVTYYDVLREYQRTLGARAGREKLFRDYTVITRPVDKRDNYVKRCIALPGDTIRIEHSEVWVNGEPQREIPGRQYNYYVRTDGTTINPELFGQMGIAQSDILYDAGTYFLPLTDENVERLRSLRNVREIVRYEATGADPDIFPNSESYPWNVDNFGPLWVPRKGATVALTEANLPLYRRIIETYEGNRLEVSDGQIRINGEPADSYTFAMDYYFMMGDNRHNSLDSRYWGFVPEDHIVGKPSFVWLSLDKEKSFPANIRWNRIFRGVK